MPECRRRIDLDDLEGIPAPPAQQAAAPCLHFIAAWGGERGGMAEAVMWGLALNREFLVRNLRPKDMRPERIAEERPRLEWVARQFAHVVLSDPDAEDAGYAPGVLFGDRHEANHVAREFARYLLGDDPQLGGGSI